MTATSPAEGFLQCHIFRLPAELFQIVFSFLSRYESVQFTWDKRKYSVPQMLVLTQVSRAFRRYAQDSVFWDGCDFDRFLCANDIPRDIAGYFGISL
jgi:hypothetical protein